MTTFNTLEDVYHEWQNNFQFKTEFKKNPEKALAEAGLTLSPDDLKKIKLLLDDEEGTDGADGTLGPRINK
jgi:hypothetical protein